METKHLSAPLTLKADGEAGQVSAVFSTFDVLDKGNDIVLATAFTHGQEVPMVWSHRWDLPVGKGQVLVETGQAVFDGRFFLETDAGKEAYATVKAMGSLQQYSWGFSVDDAAFEQRGDQMVRLIRKATVYEVSPVLVGEGLGTYTRNLKGLTYHDEAEAVLAAARAFVDRSLSLADTRRKEGRVLSSANRTRLASLKESLASVLADIDELLSATEPQKAADLSSLLAEFERITFDLHA